MKKLIKYINANVLLKVVHLNSATIITKIIAGILTSKAIAIFIGVEGLALIGNIRNFFTALQSVAVLGFYNGLVKYIAEFKDDALKLSKTLSTAYYLGFLSTILLSFICYYNADAINNFLFSPNYNYVYIIKILAFALPFYSLNMFSFSIMNGFKKYRILMVINIIGQALGLFVSLVLIYQNKMDGALIAVVIAPSLAFLITLVGIINRRSLVYSIKISNIDVDILKKLIPFTAMALVATLAMPIIYIFIRNYIIDTSGMKDAGYWEAMNRISDYYLMFVSSLITLYILPKFSGIESKREFKNEIINLYKSVIPVFALGLFLIYLLRPFIVKLVFSEAFQPVENLFGWQLMGDFIKILSMVIAYQFIAKKMFAHFIVIELFLVIIIYFSSVYLVDVFGVKGAVIAHFISYVMYFGIVLLLFNSALFGVISNEEKR
ncbi:O-antigen translocase [Flavobacteriaceae bacterium LMO-SS05]